MELNEPRRRGRPRKVLPPPKPRPPLTHRISQWCYLTGESRSTVAQRIKNGELKVIKTGPKTSPWRIPTTEYLRLGFIQSLDELL
jgi:hypothetical protein